MRRIGEWPAELAEMRELAKVVGARMMHVENPCLEGDGGGQCFKRALDRIFVKLDGLEGDPKSSVRVLHLGDSHIAADYISGTIRQRLQAKFGGHSRGYIHVDQRKGFGGRRLGRTGPWRRHRMVDEGQGGQAFGFSGVALEATKPGAKIEYLVGDEDRLVVFFHAGPQGGSFDVSLDGTPLGRVDTASSKPKTDSKTFTFPRKEEVERKLTLITRGGTVRLYGLSFEVAGGGIGWDSIGPVGATAGVYTESGAHSMKTQIEAVRPDFVVIMLGGNDALMIRQNKMSLEQVEQTFEALLDRVLGAAPDADCMLWSPMDAGTKNGDEVVSKSLIGDVRAVQRKVASKKRCAFWDMYEAMGGDGSAAKWFEKGILMDDLVHPRRAGGELLGHLFANAFLRAYQAD